MATVTRTAGGRSARPRPRRRIRPDAGAPAEERPSRAIAGCGRRLAADAGPGARAAGRVPIIRRGLSPTASTRSSTDRRSRPIQAVALPRLADPSLAAGLGERRYRPTEFENALYLPLGAEQAASPAPIPAVVARPIAPDEADTWAEVFAAAFAGTPDVPPGLLELARVYDETPSITPYLALLDGEPAGGGSLFVADDVALLSGSSVLPQSRNRGLHAALLHARLDQARRLGCDLAVMAALPASGSHRNVERLGFRVAYTRVAFVRDRPN